MKRGDIIIMLICLAVAGVLALPRLFAPPAAKLIIKTQGLAQNEYSLNENRILEGLNGVSVEILDGRARVINSPCRDQLCEKVGWLSRSGDVAICLPQRVALRVAGEKSRVDGMAY